MITHTPALDTVEPRTGHHRIPFNRPVVSARAEALLAGVLQSDHLGGDGPFGGQCQRLLQRVLGAARVLLTPSCTHALEMAALLLGARQGDEVIVPAFTFVATANAFAMHGFRPVFADIRPDTLSLDHEQLARHVSPRTRAVVAMHYAGVACDLDPIQETCRGRDLVMVEDNAHGLLGTYKGRPLGSFGALATQSFHETKNITCGQGGALVVNDVALAERAEVVRHGGTDRARFSRREVSNYTWIDGGSNWTLSEIQAAVLWAHLEDRDVIQERRQHIWARYQASLCAWARGHGVQQPHVPDWAGHPAHLYHLVMPTHASRDALIAHLRRLGIQAVFHYGALNVSRMGQQFGGRPGTCPVAEDISARLVRLPFFDSMSPADQDEVVAAVTAFVP